MGLEVEYARKFRDWVRREISAYLEQLGFIGGTLNPNNVPAHTHTESDVTDLDHDAIKIQGRDVSSASPTTGDRLTWDGAEWIPQAQGGLYTDEALYDEVTGDPLYDEVTGEQLYAQVWTSYSLADHDHTIDGGTF